jgi:hypothetical protein
MVGRYLLRSFNWEGKVSIWLAFMMGFALVILLSEIPIVGIFINVAAACIALGSIALSIYSGIIKEAVLLPIRSFCCPLG